MPSQNMCIQYQFGRGSADQISAGCVPKLEVSNPKRNSSAMRKYPPVQRKLFNKDDEQVVKYRRNKYSFLTNNSEKRLKCDVCGRRLATKVKLEEHILTHVLNLDERQTFACDWCERRFTKKSHMVKHRLIHGSLLDSDRIAVCNSFERRYMVNTFKSADNFTEYFVCQDCGKQYIQKTKLKQHRLKTHAVDDELVELYTPISSDDFFTIIDLQ